MMKGWEWKSLCNKATYSQELNSISNQILSRPPPAGFYPSALHSLNGSLCFLYEALNIYKKALAYQSYTRRHMNLLGGLGPAVQNLTKLLAKVMLKFLAWNKANRLTFFCWKNVSSFCIAMHCKSYSYFCSKNINVYENTLATTVNKFVINKLIKLTMLWTTRPRLLLQLL